MIFHLICWICGRLTTRGEWLSLLSPFTLIQSSVVRISFLNGTFCLSNFSLGDFLLLSLPFSFPLPLHSQGFSLIILQCQILSEGCYSQWVLAGRARRAPCVCEIMLHQASGNFSCCTMLYQHRDKNIPSDKSERDTVRAK